MKTIVNHALTQVTLEEAMICNTLQTLNEEAFEDVVCSERPSPSPTLGQQPTGEQVQQQQQLAPIRESAECGSLFGDSASTEHRSVAVSNGGLALQEHSIAQHTQHATTTTHQASTLMHAINQQQSSSTPPHKHICNGNAGASNHHQQQQQSHNSFAHNFAYDVDSSVNNASASVDPLPTVIIIPSSTVDDTPL